MMIAVLNICIVDDADFLFIVNMYCFSDITLLSCPSDEWNFYIVQYILYVSSHSKVYVVASSKICSSVAVVV